MKKLTPEETGAARWVPGLCLYPGCHDPVVDPAGLTAERSFCAPHGVRVAAHTAEQERQRADERAALPRRLVVAANDDTIPARYADVKVPAGTDDERAAAYALLRERVKCQHFTKVLRATKAAAEFVVACRGAVVLFAGPTGTGKSTLMALVLRFVEEIVPRAPFGANLTFQRGGLFGRPWPFADNDPLTLWSSGDDLFEMARDGDLRLPKNVSLAAVDDIGNEPSQVNAKGVSSTVWKRHEDMLGSVLTTGFVDAKADPEDVERYLAPLAERYGTAFVRRLAEPGSKHCRVVPLLPVVSS